MADLESVKLLIPGTGHVFYADVDTEPFSLEAFVFGTPATYGDWTWLGDTSADALAEFTTEGGEPTVHRTWDRQGARVTYADRTVGATINSVNLSRDTFELGYGGSVYDSTNRSHRVGANATATEKALFIVTYEQEIAGLYLPNTSIRGDLPTFTGLDTFMQVPLNVSVMGSPTQQAGLSGPLHFEWFEPRPRTAPGA